MGQQFVDQVEKSPAGQKPYGRGDIGYLPQFFGQLDAGRQQGPEACRDHDPGREPQHAIEHLFVDGFEEEDEARAKRGHAPGEKRSDECLHYRPKLSDPADHIMNLL